VLLLMALLMALLLAPLTSKLPTCQVPQDPSLAPPHPPPLTPLLPGAVGAFGTGHVVNQEAAWQAWQQQHHNREGADYFCGQVSFIASFDPMNIGLLFCALCSALLYALLMRCVCAAYAMRMRCLCAAVICSAYARWCADNGTTLENWR
jgi:hypothetical protein